MVLGLQCHVICYRSNWSNKGEVSVDTKEPVKCLKSEPFLKSFALIIRVDNTFICNIKTTLTFWVYTKKNNFVYIVIRYWRPNCITFPRTFVYLCIFYYIQPNRVFLRLFLNQYRNPVRVGIKPGFYSIARPGWVLLGFSGHISSNTCICSVFFHKVTKE